MRTESIKVPARLADVSDAGSRALRRLSATLLVVAASACGPAQESFEPEPPRVQQGQALELLNGLSLNGLSLNGLSLNGLSLNGLSLNGLSTVEFTSWFLSDPALNDVVMKYVVHCAVPAGESRTFTSMGLDGIKIHTWPGGLGLAPDWAGGAPSSVAEQQLVSACLAAHANKYGRHIRISVLGKTARDELLPHTATELSTYSEKEACFFGNLFNNEGLFVGNNGRMLTNRESTARACALSTSKNAASQECAPLVRVTTDCARLCVPDISKGHYATCTYNGVTYRPLTTRMLREDIYFCGDGVCQFTEKCGTGETHDSCGKDCGPCP